MKTKNELRLNQICLMTQTKGPQDGLFRIVMGQLVIFLYRLKVSKHDLAAVAPLLLKCQGKLQALLPSSGHTRG